MKIKKIEDFIRPYVITNGKKFKLKDIDPEDTGGLKSEFKKEAQKYLQKGVSRLADFQDKLYAQDRWGLLLIFQAMDAAGKDGTIKHVMSGVNPQGVQVYSFKAPSSEDLDHDYMWRCVKRVPERGRIGIFNRSYYEEVLVVRVHQEILENQKIPSELVSKKIWKERFDDIRNYERYLTRNGIAVRKFFLHISKSEQKKRFLDRLEQPNKNWKFSLADAKERDYWKDYQHAYEDMIQNTSTEYAPWVVVPANSKWFARLLVAGAVIAALEEMDLAYPKVDREKQKELQAAREALESQA
jgi:PPK2 family polyphosphate:nucleotide phosphotransferase